MRPETKLQKKPFRDKPKQHSQRQRAKTHTKVRARDIRAVKRIQKELAPGFVIEEDDLIGV